MSDRDDERGKRPDDREVDPDAPPTAEEIAASKRLRDALDTLADAGDSSQRDDVDLATALRAAWSPERLDDRVHASMVDDLPTDEELALATELRNALSLPRELQPETVRALRSAWSPTEIEDEEHRAIVARAVGRAGGGVVSLDMARSRARATRKVVVTAVSILALAASVVVWMTASFEHGSARGREAPLAKARSTQPLFDEPFKAGETSARIDRIVMARASDYRENRFAKWGVR